MVATARESSFCCTVSHLKDQVRIIEQVGTGRLFESSSLNLECGVQDPDEIFQ